MIILIKGKGLFNINDQVHLSFTEFVEHLRKECEYQLDGGTKYRQTTAENSLEVALKVKDANLFLTQENAEKLVKEYMPSLDDERLNDVSKMLRVLAGRMLHEKTVSEDLKAYREKKSKSKLRLIYK